MLRRHISIDPVRSTQCRSGTQLVFSETCYSTSAIPKSHPFHSCTSLPNSSQTRRHWSPPWQSQQLWQYHPNRMPRQILENNDANYSLLVNGARCTNAWAEVLQSRISRECPCTLPARLICPKKHFATIVRYQQLSHYAESTHGVICRWFTNWPV